MVEEWKEIEYKGYFISNFGNFQGRSGKIIKLILNKNTGYYGSCIKPNGRKGKAKSLKIHRLVAEAFIPNPKNLPQVNHKDGNKLNNHVSNLEWCTNQDNHLHAHRIGLQCNKKGYEHAHSKLTKEEVLYIRQVYIPKDKNFGCRVLAKRFNISHCRLSEIINKKVYIFEDT